MLISLKIKIVHMVIICDLDGFIRIYGPRNTNRGFHEEAVPSIPYNVSGIHLLQSLLHKFTGKVFFSYRHCGSKEKTTEI